jgi:hypothetical protein
MASIPLICGIPDPFPSTGTQTDGPLDERERRPMAELIHAADDRRRRVQAKKSDFAGRGRGARREEREKPRPDQSCASPPQNAARELTELNCSRRFQINPVQYSGWLPRR